MEKFIVIGSNSFSGASFIDYVLKDNHRAEVIGISRSSENLDCFLPYKKRANIDKFKFYQLDLNKDVDSIINIVKKNRPDYIVNFAAQGMVAQSWESPEQWFRTNCLAVMNLANRLTAEKYLKRYIQISSPEVYGACNNVTESSARLKPSTPYAASKACGDISLYPFFVNRGLPLVYTRATNVYGPYQQLYRIIPRTVLFVKMGIKIQLQGGGKAVKSYIHIKDVCDATLRIARNGHNGEVYHISPDGSGISVYDLVKFICTKLDKDIMECVEMTDDRIGQDSVYVIDSKKIRQELSWRPRTSLSEGLEEVIAWIDEYYDDLIKAPMNYIHKP